MSEATEWRLYHDSIAHARIGQPPPDERGIEVELFDEPPDDDVDPSVVRRPDVAAWTYDKASRCSMHYPRRNPRWQAEQVERLKRGSRR